MPTITDWIVALCTVIYVFATIIIMCANGKATSISKKQMQEGKMQFEKQQRLLIRPYLNLYVARDDEHIDGKEHYSIDIDNDSTKNYKNCREISIRNIGNGTAKDIQIITTMHGNVFSSNKLPIRNGFLLVNKQYVYDVKFDEFKKISLICLFTDLFDNRYKQEMEVCYDTEKGDIIAHTYNPIFLED